MKNLQDTADKLAIIAVSIECLPYFSENPDVSL